MILSQLKTLVEKEEAILNQVEEHQKCTQDEDVTIGQLSYDPGTPEAGFTTRHTPFRLRKEEEQCIALDPHAESQLLSRMGIPVGYFRKCPWYLKTHNANHWLSIFSDKQIKLRWFDNYVRAIFSSRYSTELDDHELVPVALQAFRQACVDPEENLHLKDFIQTGDFTMLRALFKDARTVHEGIHYFAGVTIVNSEVGKSSIWIRPTVRSGNEFGAHDFTDRSREGTLSIRHVGQLDVEKVRKAIIHAREVATVGVHQLMTVGQEIVENPVEETKALVEESDFLTQRMVQVVEEEYQDKLNVTKLRLAQTILEAVREMPLFQRYLAEQAVGRYLDLFSNTKQRLEQITLDMKNLECLSSGTPRNAWKPSRMTSGN